MTLVHTNDPRIPRLQTLLTQLVFGESSPESTCTELVQILKARP